LGTGECFWSQLPAPSHPAAAHSFPVSRQGLLFGVTWRWSQLPTPSHPASVHSFWSVSAHGVLEGSGVCFWSQLPAPSHPAAAHSFPVSAHGLLSGRTWRWSQFPAPSQPASVHEFWSVSVHTVLDGTLVKEHTPC